VDWLASQATREVLFKGTVFSRPSDGTKQTLSRITLQDVKDFYKRYYTPNSADAVVVGDITQSQLTKALAPIGQWQGAPA
ncbi:hypothetical protein UB42_20825, partial [Photobacterium leiognathi]